MAVVSARPAALQRFTDELSARDGAMRECADDVRAALVVYLHRNPDHGVDVTAVADGLAAVAEQLLELDQHVGATAAAFRQLDADGPVATVTQDRLDALYAEHDGTITDLRDAIVPVSAELWWRLVYGSWQCPDGLPGRYRGGGGIIGPDGRLYPLVIPELLVDGELFHATTSTDPRSDPAALGGSDPTWRRITTLQGVARFADTGTSAGARVAVGIGVATGGNAGAFRFADGSVLTQLRISPGGWPTLPAGRAPAGPQQRPRPGAVRFEGRQVPLRVDGQLRMVEPTTIDRPQTTS